MEVDYNAKIIKVLKKLLDPDFRVKNEVYLNSLLSHLTNKEETKLNMKLQELNKEQFPVWLMEAIEQWENSECSPSSNILSFTLNIASFVSKEEQTFVMLNRNNIFERLIKLINVYEPTTCPSVKLAFIKLITSFLEHKSGLQWIISTNFWADIMCLTLKNQTLYITKEGYKFMMNLLDRSIKINEMFCSNVVQLMMAPLSKNSPCVPGTGIVSTVEVRDQAIYQSLCSTLSLITAILELLLEKTKSSNDFDVILMFKDKFDLEGRIRNLLKIAQNDDFVYDLYKIIYIMGFFEVLWTFGGNETIIYEHMRECEMIIFRVLKDCAARDSVQNLLKLCYIGHSYWKHISGKMPVVMKYNTNYVTFEHQIVILQLCPVIALSCHLLGGRQFNTEMVENDEVRDEFVTKILKNVTPTTLRVGYKWQEVLFYNPYTFDHATLALKYLLKSKQFFTREIGTICFQCLMYCLRDIIHVLKEKPDQIVVLSKEYGYTALLLDSIAVYIKEFNLTWRDGIETICVLAAAFDFLSFPTWSVKLVVKALKLVDIAISNYMAPNMALLIDNVNDDSSMCFIGPMLYVKLHDCSWEVRDSALEVLCTVSHNALNKFPSFRKIILEADLPSQVLKMSIKDDEAFVRSTAIKCLQEMSQEPEFWCKILEAGDIYEEIFKILSKETEGIVRTEAAKLMATIYENQAIPETVLSRVYDIMSHAAIVDLHWEVRVNALSFWAKVIQNHLTHQGMIDGTFPNVTFSKEHRKIVTLNACEVRKRLIKVLYQLSETGCLAVLVATLQDDCDLEVSKTATNIIKKMVVLLQNYDVTISNATVSAPPSPLTPFPCVPSPSYSGDSQYHSMSPLSQLSQSSVNNSPVNSPNLEVTESILNDIMNSQDMNLLEGVFALPNQSSGHVQIRNKEVLSPGDFLKLAYSDVDSYCNQKRKWLNGLDDFDSLLEDILKDYNENDINSMDCY